MRAEYKVRNFLEFRSGWAGGITEHPMFTSNALHTQTESALFRVRMRAQNEREFRDPLARVPELNIPYVGGIFAGNNRNPLVGRMTR